MDASKTREELQSLQKQARDYSSEVTRLIWGLEGTRKDLIKTGNLGEALSAVNDELAALEYSRQRNHVRQGRIDADLHAMDIRDQYAVGDQVTVTWDGGRTTQATIVKYLADCVVVKTPLGRRHVQYSQIPTPEDH